MISFGLKFDPLEEVQKKRAAAMAARDQMMGVRGSVDGQRGRRGSAGKQMGRRGSAMMAQSGPNGGGTATGASQGGFRGYLDDLRSDPNRVGMIAGGLAMMAGAGYQNGQNLQRSFTNLVQGSQDRKAKAKAQADQEAALNNLLAQYPRFAHLVAVDQNAGVKAIADSMKEAGAAGFTLGKGQTRFEQQADGSFKAVASGPGANADPLGSVQERLAMLRAAGIDPSSDHAKRFLVTGEMGEAGNLPSDVQSLQWRAKAAGLQEGSQAYNDFILNGGKAKPDTGLMTVGANQRVFDPATGQTVLAAQDKPQTGKIYNLGGRLVRVSDGQAQEIYSAPTQADETILIKEYKFAQQNGYDGSFSDYAKMRRGGQTINVGPQTDARRKSYDGAMGKADADAYVNYTENLATARNLLASLDQLAPLVETASQGFGNEIEQKVRALAVRLGGKDDPTLSATQAFASMANELALGKLGGSLGTGFSNADRDFIMQTVPNLANTPGGNRLVVEALRRAANRKKEIAQAAISYAKAHGGVFDSAGFQAELSKFESNPLFTAEDRARAEAIVNGPLGIDDPSKLEMVGGETLPQSGSAKPIATMSAADIINIDVATLSDEELAALEQRLNELGVAP